IESGRAAVRIGIHLGDVIDSAGDTFGDSVNIACRLESIALQNGICVSERAWSDLRQRNVSFRDLGVQQLKNIETPIRVFMYDSGAASVTRPHTFRRRSWASPLKSRAVIAALVLLVACAAGGALWLYGLRGGGAEGRARTAINRALDAVPCSWLKLTDFNRSPTRSVAKLAGYANVPPARVREMLVHQLTGRLDGSVTIDTAAVGAITDSDCSFVEEASRSKYDGLSRAELVAVVPSASPEYRERYARKVPPGVKMVYDVRIFTRDFSPNAQLFAIDAADGLQYLRTVARVRTRYPEEANIPGGVVHALTWTDQQAPGLFFIVDSKTPIDVHDVEQDLGTMAGSARFRAAAAKGRWKFELVVLKGP
ncbi:MAG: adenylate/guanylate cyclase domain-containing protein, partial [Alphaproteobacteria bacterium]